MHQSRFHEVNGKPVMVPCIRREPKHSDRRGIVVLELILGLSILVVLVLAAVEFALLFVNLKQLEFSSRVGAKVAADLTTNDLGNVASADTVKAVVDQVLTASIGATSCQVFLEHNATCDGLTVGPPYSSSATCAGCTTPTYSLPTTADVQSGSVRVTVCIDAANLAPDLLDSLGFSIQGRIVSVSTTFPYEGCTAGPEVIPITNASFENPLAATGGTNSPFTGWTTETGAAVVFRPDPTLTTPELNPIPDGVQVACLETPATASSTARISQTLTGSQRIEDGEDYTLTVWIGDAVSDTAPDDWIVRLKSSDGDLLGTSAGIVPGNGSFTRVTVSGQGDANSDNEFFVIELEVTNTSGGNRVGYFDNVRLLREN